METSVCVGRLSAATSLGGFLLIGLLVGLLRERTVNKAGEWMGFAIAMWLLCTFLVLDVPLWVRKKVGRILKQNL
jgi:hypothetical protein